MLLGATALPTDQDESLTLTCQVIEKLLIRCHKSLNPSLCPAIVRLILESRTTSAIDQSCTQYLYSDTTVNKYILEWKHFFCYLLRSNQTTSHNLTLTAGQRDMIGKLHETLQERDESEIDAAIFDLSLDILQQYLPGSGLTRP